MANKYPHIGNSTDCITIHNSDNHPIPSIWKNLSTPFRLFSMLGVMLLICNTIWGQQNQNINWNADNNTTRNYYYNMCGNSNANYNSLQTCNSCTKYYTINESDRQQNNQQWRNAGWMSFKAPDGCKITVTLTANGLAGSEWIYLSHGRTSNSTDSYAVYWSSSTSTNSTFESNLGGWITIYYDNFNGRNATSSFTLTVRCNCCTNRDAYIHITGCQNIVVGQSITVTGSLDNGHGAGAASWSASNANITVTDNGNNTATITGLTPGNNIPITYTRAENGGYCEASATCYINVTCTQPENSSCATATTLICGATLNGSTECTTGTTHGTSFSISNYGVWYTFTGDGNGTTITSNTGGSFDHAMAILKGSCGDFEYIEYVDGSYASGSESYTFDETEIGETYYIYIAYYSDYGTSSDAGAFTISRECPCPEPTNLTVSDITNATATVSWIGSADSYNIRWFEYVDHANVTLTAGDVWEDGTGYQMLLDADANTYGTTIPTTGGLTTDGDASAATYAEFEYKIPTNADGALTTVNIVLSNSITIQVPAGTYDWCITNPTPGDRMWIASENGSIGGRADDFVFEAGFNYEFVVSLEGSNDRTDLTITPIGTVHTANGVTDNPYTITGLTAGATYIVQVQSNCGGIQSNWTDPEIFTTCNLNATIEFGD